MPFLANGKSIILVLGDSLSNAHGIELKQSWVYLLQERLEKQHFAYEVINISMSGDTTSNGIEKLPAALATYQPAIVIIALGANDGLQGLPITLIHQNLKMLVTLAKKQRANVLLVGMLIPLNYGPIYCEQFEKVYSTISREYQLIQVPFLLKDVALDPKLMQADGLHPTADAQSLILDNVWPYLKKMLKNKQQSRLGQLK